MAETTGIGWTDATINFWHGCHKVSEGCKFCYMFRDKARWKKDGNIVKKTQPGTINSTLQKLKAKFDQTGQRIKVFTCSYSDFFIEDADGWRKEAWDIIRDHPFIDWQILTKRIDRAEECLPEDWGEGWDHVWLGVSAENQARWDERVPLLGNIPAKIRFVSVEPLLGQINIWEEHVWQDNGESELSPTFKGWKAIDWVIVGGESGNDQGPWKYRPCEREWILRIVNKCRVFNIPVFVKQLGTSIAKFEKFHDRAGANPEEWVGSYRDLKIQQFPKSVFA